MLRCADDTLYCGITNDLPRRLELHREGKGAKYTRGRAPLTVVYTEEGYSKSDALLRERAIKRMKRSAKLLLIEVHNAAEKST